MAKTHAKFIQVFLDNAAGALTDITAYVNKISSIGLKYDEQDMTAWSDGSKNIVIGQPEAPLEIGGPYNDVFHAIAIVLNGRPTPLSLDIRIGKNAAPQAGDPQFGITSTATDGYVMTNYQIDPSSMTWTANLNVMGSTAPAWGTANET